jgi:glutaminyl-peptide cyclotransferase
MAKALVRMIVVDVIDRNRIVGDLLMRRMDRSIVSLVGSRLRRWLGPLALGAVAVVGSAVAYAFGRAYPLGWGGAPPPLLNPAAAARGEAAWRGDRAMNDIAMLLRHTPRSPGTAGQAATLAYIEEELARAGRFRVERQAFRWRRADGVELPLVNIVARLAPENPVRILIGTHHDSLIRAYRDPVSPDAPMPGASNSGSGVAVLLETARALAAADAPPPVGVDLVFFDGEEGPHALGGGERNWQALGSTRFVDRLSEFYRAPPAAVVVIDLVCREGLRLQPERNSLRTGKDEAVRMWRVGTSVAPAVFDWRALKGGVGDDHTAFWRAGIPAILLIDIRPTDWFNTTRDTIDKCRPASLSAVGRTLVRYLYSDRGSADGSRHR